MTQYMLSVHQGPTDDAVVATMTPDDIQAMYAAVEVFNAEVRDAGAWVFAGGLQTIDMSTTVDNTGAEPVVTDGPFAESKEYLGGFWIIEAADLDAALDWAKRGSKACQGPVEVRPFQDEPSE
ncbi:MAG: YciI family protein [Nocardioides sp.]